MQTRFAFVSFSNQNFASFSRSRKSALLLLRCSREFAEPRVQSVVRVEADVRSEFAVDCVAFRFVLHYAYAALSVSLQFRVSLSVANTNANVCNPYLMTVSSPYGTSTRHSRQQQQRQQKSQLYDATTTRERHSISGSGLRSEGVAN